MDPSMVPCSKRQRSQWGTLLPSEAANTAPAYYHNSFSAKPESSRTPLLFPAGEICMADTRSRFNNCMAYPAVVRQLAFPASHSHNVLQGDVSSYQDFVRISSVDVSPTTPSPQYQQQNDVIHQHRGGVGIDYRKSERSDPLPLVVSTKDLLHRVCFHYLGVDRVCKILKVDPSAAGNAATVEYRKKRWEWSPRGHTMVAGIRRVQAPYKYPLHLVFAATAQVARIASCSNPSMEGSEDVVGETIFVARNRKLDDCVLIIHMLLRSAPNVLQSSDGSWQGNSLAILLKEWAESCSRDATLLQHCLGLIEKLVSMNPTLVHRRDRHNNSALHVACQYNAPLVLVRAVYCLSPTDLVQRNLHGHTPLQISQQRTGIGSMRNQEQVVNFLQERSEEAHFYQA